MRDRPAWLPPHKTTLVISPHPDDETLGAGGLIAYQAARGIPTPIVAVTDGEAAYPDVIGLAERRHREQRKAVEVLSAGASLIRLKLPDSAVSLHEAPLRRLLEPLITADMLVVAPWLNDWHPDHEACGRVVKEMCETIHAEHVSYVFWTWHQRTPEAFNQVKLVRLELNKEVLAVKQAALNCHQSQLVHESGDPILPQRLLAPAFRPFEIFISYAD